MDATGCEAPVEEIVLPLASIDCVRGLIADGSINPATSMAKEADRLRVTCVSIEDEIAIRLCFSIPRDLVRAAQRRT